MRRRKVAAPIEKQNITGDLLYALIPPLRSTYVLFIANGSYIRVLVQVLSRPIVAPVVNNHNFNVILK